MSSNKYTITLRAFSLIEVLITITLLIMLSTVMLVDFSGTRVGRELEGSAREAAAVFREAQNYALTGRTVTGSGIPGTATPCYFKMSWSGGAGSYVFTYIYKNTSSSTCSPTGPSFVIATYPLKSGVVFSSGGSFYFSLPHASVFDGSTDNPVSPSKAVTISKAGTFYTICTYESGLINHYAGASCP